MVYLIISVVALVIAIAAYIRSGQVLRLIEAELDKPLRPVVPDTPRFPPPPKPQGLGWGDGF